MSWRDLIIAIAVFAAVAAILVVYALRALGADLDMCDVEQLAGFWSVRGIRRLKVADVLIVLKKAFYVTTAPAC